MENTTAEQIRVLIVDDTPEDAEIILKELCSGGYEPFARRVDSPIGLFDALKSQDWDVIVADYTMPNFDAIGALRVLRSTGLDLPFIVVSDTIGEATAVKAIKSGAHDFIVKHDLARLVPSVRRELRDAIVRRQRNAAEAQLMHLAFHDSLTGLPNRLMLLKKLKQALFDADRHNRHVSIMFLDLDRFKSINDTLGHSVGDVLLKSVADRLRSCMQCGDVVARLGGDEFAIVLPDQDDPDGAADVADRILDQFVEPFQIDSQLHYASASIGISVYPRDGLQFEELLKHADAAMYSAKAAGRNNYRFFTHDMVSQIMDNMSLESGLHSALASNNFELRYQPLVDVQTRRVTSFEALLYWEHPDHGLIGPNLFIPLAEESGLINPIGEWVMHAVCRQAHKWKTWGGCPVRLSFNVSPRQFNSRGFSSKIYHMLEKCGLPASCFGIELTENAVMHDPETASATLTQLAGMGVWISIDDFGTGYSSFGYLKKFPVHAVKIDRSFVQDLPDNKDNVAIVQAMINMAHNLGMKVVAEGVETLAQFKFLREHGCDIVQGYLFAPPLSVPTCESRLKKNDGQISFKYSKSA